MRHQEYRKNIEYLFSECYRKCIWIQKKFAGQISMKIAKHDVMVAYWEKLVAKFVSSDPTYKKKYKDVYSHAK